MHKPEAVQENQINTDRSISVRSLVLIKKKKITRPLIDFAILVDYKVKIIGNEKMNKYLDLTS